MFSVESAGLMMQAKAEARMQEAEHKKAKMMQVCKTGITAVISKHPLLQNWQTCVIQRQNWVMICAHHCHHQCMHGAASCQYMSALA